MDRKDLVRRYRETPRPAGVYRVTHRPSGRTKLGVSPDAQAMLNRIQAQLAMGSHPTNELQRDWDNDGEAAFDFEVVDVLPPPADPTADISDDLATLHELWQDKLHIDRGLSY